MTLFNRASRYSRRSFLAGTARLGAGVAVLAASGSLSAAPALAWGGPPERVKVLLADLTDATAADFGRGQARGLQLIAEGGRTALAGTAGGEFTSGTVALPFPATHLGLHWVVQSRTPAALTVSVRTSDDGRAWSAWRPLTIEAVADRPVGREVFATLVAGDRASFAQYRAVFPSAETATLESMTITAINSVDGPREAVTAQARTSATFTARDGSPFTVVTREGWGCDESLRVRVRKEIWPEMYVPAKKVVLHHTATSNAYVDGAAEVRAIYTYHARTQGWGDIGYHLLIDRSGQIYEGRHGRGEDPATREILSADVVAGHVYGHNYGSTGIACIGNFHDAEPPGEMLAAVEDAATFECGRHFIDPTAVSDFLKSDGTWHAGLDNCSGHRDSYPTACPGQYLQPYLSTLRANVATRLNGTPAPTLSSTTPTGAGSTPLTAPATLAFTWSADVALYCLEGWYKAPDREPITYLSGYTDVVFGGETAKAQTWMTAPAGGIKFSNLAAGHYTMHVRSTNGVYEANRTYLVNPRGRS